MGWAETDRRGSLALTARIQGLVIVEAIIDMQGRVQDARVLRTDSPLFNGAALNAVRQWTTGQRCSTGVPVSIVMTVTVQFRLQ
jgi:TonB family protein